MRYPAPLPTRHGDSAMCCGFEVEARARAKKLVRHGGREFFVTRSRFAARIPPQSPVPSHCHRAGRAASSKLVDTNGVDRVDQSQVKSVPVYINKARTQ